MDSSGTDVRETKAYADEDEVGEGLVDVEADGKEKGRRSSIRMRYLASNVAATLLMRCGVERDTVLFTLAVRLLEPLSGFIFFLFAPSLWPLVVVAMAVVAIIYICLTVLMMTFALPPQAELIGLAVGDAAGWTFATSLTLVESALLSWLLTNLMMDYTKRRIYDEVFALHEIERPSLLDVPFNKKVKETLYTTLVLVILMTVFLVLNVIPLVGSLLYVLVLAWAYAWAIESLYLTSAGLTARQQMEWVLTGDWRRLLEFELFGTCALLLQLVPLLNIVFYFTNVVGGALWACEVERRGLLRVLKGESAALLSSSSEYATSEDE